MSNFELPVYQLRPADQPGDDDFIFRCYEAGMRQHVEWAWGWEATAQRQGLRMNLPSSGFRIVECSGSLAGILCVQVRDNAHLLRMIVLKPPFRNLGLGSRLIEAEIHRAHRAGKRLLLNVIKSNRAKTLYERLGMSVVGEDLKTFSMQSSGQAGLPLPAEAV